MENTTNDHSEPPADHSTTDDHQENSMPQDTATEPQDTPTEMVMDSKQETGEDGRKILEIIASTGKFWLEWEKLKSLLSRQLKQVLSEYPEVKMSREEQISLLGDTYEELVNKFDEALCSFIEGPPFTLQRLCEIILGARGIYPKLSKLALALEKCLLVTSTLTVSTDPYPPPITRLSVEVEKIEEPIPQSDPVQNGVENLITDKNEVIEKVEAAEGNGEGSDDMIIDEKAPEEKSESATPDPTPTTESKPVDFQSL